MRLFFLLLTWFGLEVGLGFRGAETPTTIPTRPVKMSSYDEEESQVWVCSNRWCRERGAATAMGASIALMGSSASVRAHKCFGRCGVGPNVAATTSRGTVLEFHHVDTAEKVCRIAEHLGIRADATVAKCLELSLQASKVLDEGNNPELAVALYTAALGTGHREQAGVVLEGRAFARLALASGHRDSVMSKVSNYKSATGRRVRASPEQARARLVAFLGASYESVSFVSETVTTRTGWRKLLRRETKRPIVLARSSPITLVALRALADSLADDSERAAVDFDFNMHEIEVTRALEDALAATEKLPSWSKAWRTLAKALTATRREEDAVIFLNIADDLDASPSTPPQFDDDIREDDDDDLQEGDDDQEMSGPVELSDRPLDDENQRELPQKQQTNLTMSSSQPIS